MHVVVNYWGTLALPELLLPPEEEPPEEDPLETLMVEEPLLS